MGTLTVRENLHFSAALRLPSHMTHKQRKERVEGVIRELGLMRCANTKVTVHVVCNCVNFFSYRSKQLYNVYTHV